jgi:hypothetical protein
MVTESISETKCEGYNEYQSSIATVFLVFLVFLVLLVFAPELLIRTSFENHPRFCYTIQ